MVTYKLVGIVENICNLPGNTQQVMSVLVFCSIPLNVCHFFKILIRRLHFFYLFILNGSHRWKLNKQLFKGLGEH